MTAEIIYFNSDCERIANAERLGLDPGYLAPFSGDPEAVHALGVLTRTCPDAIHLDFTPATGDLAVYIRRGIGVSQIARLTGLSEPLVRAFYEGFDDADV